MPMLNLNLDQVLGGMVFGWLTLGIFLVIMEGYLKHDGNWIPPSEAWPQPKNKRTSIK